MEVPPGAAHRQLRRATVADGHVRVAGRAAPAARRRFLERARRASCATGELNRVGLATPVAGARLVRDFGDEGHAARPSLARAAGARAHRR